MQNRKTNRLLHRKSQPSFGEQRSVDLQARRSAEPMLDLRPFNDEPKQSEHLIDLSPTSSPEQTNFFEVMPATMIPTHLALPKRHNRRRQITAQVVLILAALFFMVSLSMRIQQLAP